MNIVPRALLLSFFVSLVLAPAYAAPGIYVGDNATPLEWGAAHELQRYIHAMTGDTLPIETTGAVRWGAEGFVIGAPESLPRLTRQWPFGLDEPEHDGYILWTAPNGVVVISGGEPRGVQNGVYAFLERLGFGFYLDGDTHPDRVRGFGRLEIPEFNESVSPVSSIRGALPWHTKLWGPITWEPADYRAYIDQLARMRMNLVAFRAHDSQPFAAFEREGVLTGGEPLPATAQPGWDIPAMAAEDYLAGTGMYFSSEYFGAESAFAPTRAERISEAQDVLREAMAYAKGRGLQVGLGFEVRGDALDPGVQDNLEARLLALLDNYPDLDHVWIWQPRGMAAHLATTLPEHRGPWDSHTQHFSPALAAIAGNARQAEAVRVLLLANQAREVLQTVRPDIGLVVSGWGGDDWLHFTDFFPALDDTLPGDVTLAALENVPARDAVSNAFEALPAERARWPIVWWEQETDLWLPHVRLESMAAAYRGAAAKGVHGVIGVHWRTRGAEEAAGYAAKLAWDPGISPGEFRQTRTEHLYGAEQARAIEPVVEEIRGLTSRWALRHGHLGHAEFEWVSADAETKARLEQTLGELAEQLPEEPRLMHLVPEFLPDLVRQLPAWPMETLNPLRLFRSSQAAPPQRDALQDLYRKTQFFLAYDEAARTFASGGSFDEALEAGDPETIKEIVLESGLPEALHAYALRMRSKGEMGMLAAMNAVLWGDVRNRAGFGAAALDVLRRLPDSYTVEPGVIVLPDRVIALGFEDEELTAVMRYRALGEGEFGTHELDPLGGGAYARSVPNDIEGPANIEFGFEVRDGGGETIHRWPRGFPRMVKTMTYHQTVSEPAPAPPSREPTPPSVIETSVDRERHAVDLAWEHPPGAQAIVFRDGYELGRTYYGWWRDTEVQSGQAASYGVRFRPIGEGAPYTVQTRIQVPELPLPAPPEVIRAHTRADRIILGWDSNSPAASQYLIRKYDEGHEFIAETLVTADYGHYINHADRVTGGEVYIYEVAAVAPDGRVGRPSGRVGVRASTEPLQPTIRLSFRDEREMLRGMAEVADSALALGGTGWAELPPQSAWDPGHSLTLAVWFKPEHLDGMPVLICKGRWEEAGYFIQVFDNQVRFYMAGVDTLDAGEIKPGEWQHIVCAYGYGEMRTYINGELAGRKRVTGRPRPAGSPLLLGRYEAPEDVYFVHGLMDDIRIYDIALTDGEVREVYRDTPPE